MSVVNDGHKHTGSGGSLADAFFENSWRGTSPPTRATVGPLAPWDGRDPVKVARVLSDDTSFESTAGPGMNRVVTSPDPAAEKTEIGQDRRHARQAPSGDSEKKPSSAPSTGARGGGKGSSAAEKQQQQSSSSSSSSSSPSADRESKSYLAVSSPAPVPKELIPAPLQPVTVGSGPRARLVTDQQIDTPRGSLAMDYEKVGEAMPLDEPSVDDERETDEILDYAGVPLRLRPGSVLRGMAKTAAAASTADSQYLVRDDVHPLKLVAMLDDLLGGEWREWEPEVIGTSLAKEAGTSPGEPVMAKIMAVKIALRRPDVFYGRWQGFEKMAVALNDRQPAMTQTEELSPEEMANAVAVVEKIAGPGDFSPEVTTYVAARLFDSGMVIAPPKLSFADDILRAKVANDGLREKVAVAYGKAVKDDSAWQSPGDDDVVGIQVSRLVRTHAYVLDRLSAGGEQLSQ